jgi:hypothetical protein
VLTPTVAETEELGLRKSLRMVDVLDSMIEGAADAFRDRIERESRGAAASTMCSMR